MGTKLLNAMETYLKEQGCKDILLGVFAYNDAALNFYQKNGYHMRLIDMTKKFFTTVQNKLHFAVHEHTAAELIHERVDNKKPYVGMTNFKGDYVTIDDVKIERKILEGNGKVSHEEAIKKAEIISNLP